VRVSRIDLVSGKVEDWFSAQLQFWAGEYDGATWSIVADERLIVLDATAEGKSVLWQVADLPGTVIGFAQQDQHEALLLRQGTTVAQWRYALPARRLLGRDDVSIPENTVAVLPDCHSDSPVLVQVAAAGDGQARCLVLGSNEHATEIDWPHAQLPQASLHDGLFLLHFSAEGGWCCRAMGYDGRTVADLVLPDALEPRAALHGGHLLAWDQRGRVVDVDADSGEVRMLTFG
jgi:hypothetical protein